MHRIGTQYQQIFFQLHAFDLIVFHVACAFFFFLANIGYVEIFANFFLTNFNFIAHLLWYARPLFAQLQLEGNVRIFLKSGTNSERWEKETAFNSLCFVDILAEVTYQGLKRDWICILPYTLKSILQNGICSSYGDIKYGRLWKALLCTIRVLVIIVQSIKTERQLHEAEGFNKALQCQTDAASIHANQSRVGRAGPQVWRLRVRMYSTRSWGQNRMLISKYGFRSLIWILWGLKILHGKSIYVHVIAIWRIKFTVSITI